jgi:hypothetical protein
MKPFTGIRLLIFLALSTGLPHASIAQEAGLLPLLWEAGVGADVTARTAAPVVGGLWSCMLLTLLVLPAGYTIWRRHQVRVVMTVSLPHRAAPSEGAA